MISWLPLTCSFSYYNCQIHIVTLVHPSYQRIANNWGPLQVGGGEPGASGWWLWRPTWKAFILHLSTPKHCAWKDCASLCCHTKKCHMVSYRQPWNMNPTSHQQPSNKCVNVSTGSSPQAQGPLTSYDWSIVRRLAIDPELPTCFGPLWFSYRVKSTLSTISNHACWRLNHKPTMTSTIISNNHLSQTIGKPIMSYSQPLSIYIYI